MFITKSARVQRKKKIDKESPGKFIIKNQQHIQGKANTGTNFSRLHIFVRCYCIDFWISLIQFNIPYSQRQGYYGKSNTEKTNDQ
jgi:hypothetical protein